MQSKNIVQEIRFLRATKRYLIEEQKHFKRKIKQIRNKIYNIDNHLFLTNSIDTNSAELKEFLYKEIAETKECITKNIQEIAETEKNKIRMYALLKDNERIKENRTI